MPHALSPRAAARCHVRRACPRCRRAGRAPLLGLAVISAVAARAGAEAEGGGCWGNGFDDPTKSAKEQVWEVDAGPIVLADLAAPATPVYGRVRCVFRDGNTHTAPAYVEAV